MGAPTPVFWLSRPVLGASWGHLGQMWGHLGIPSAIWEVWLHACKLTILSALPVPMLRQVYVGASLGARNGVFARDILPKREDDDVNSMSVSRLLFKKLAKT